MQACYVNTTHPDFLNGHKAMSIVTERLNQNKPQPQEGKGGKPTSAQLNNNRDLDVDVKEEPSFFGSFFAKNQPKKKGVAVMEAVSDPLFLLSAASRPPRLRSVLTRTLRTHSLPPSSSHRPRSTSARPWRPK